RPPGRPPRRPPGRRCVPVAAREGGLRATLISVAEQRPVGLAALRAVTELGKKPRKSVAGVSAGL
ncbi:MAG: hypothetical protein DLM61_01690, partial [Pseudonocardiales bacterium]